MKNGAKSEMLVPPKIRIPVRGIDRIVLL